MELAIGWSTDVEPTMPDDRGFDAFYEATRPRLLAQLYAACGNVDEAQECLQDAYVRAWQRWAQISAYDNPEAWVHLVAWRLATNRWHRARSAVRAWTRHGPPSHAPEPTPDSVALAAALRTLPMAQRQAVVLHHLGGLPVAQIAAELGVPEGTIKARLVRGRAALAVLFAEEPSDV